MNNSKLKYLSKNIILFGISSFGPKILVFLLVPLYTRFLTTEDYGVVDMITSSSSLLMPILIITIQDAVMRYSMDSKYNPTQILTNSLWIALRGWIVGFIFIFIFSLLPFGFKDKYLYIYLFILIIINSIYNILISFIRAIDKINIIVEMSLISTLIICLSNILLLVIFKWRINGYLLSAILGPFVSSIWSVIRINIFKYINLNMMDYNLRKEMQNFSFPLVANKLAWWINNLSDRYIVTWLCGLSANGIYSVAYKIPTILTTCSDIFSQAWQLSAIKEVEDGRNISFITKMYELYNFSLVFICSLLILLNVPIAEILYANNFFVAWKYVPFLLISVVFGGLSGFIGSLFMALKKTKSFSKATILGAIINIIVSLGLVLYIGPLGAALGTLISYFIIWVIRMHDLREFIVMDIDWKKSYLMYLLLLLQAFIAMGNKGIGNVLLQIILIVLVLLINKKYLTYFLYNLKNKLGG